MLRIIPVAAAAALALAGLSREAASPRSQTTARARTLVLIVRTGDLRYIDLPPRRAVVGDVAASNGTLYDRRGQRRGRAELSAVVTRRRPFITELLGSLELRGGQITLQGAARFESSRAASLAVTGGTGVYAGARGAARFGGGPRTSGRVVLRLVR